VSAILPADAELQWFLGRCEALFQSSQRAPLSHLSRSFLQPRSSIGV